MDDKELITRLAVTRGVTLVNRRLGGLNGADRMGGEILRVLWDTAIPLRVVSWERRPPLAAKPRPVTWLMPPVTDPFPRRISRRFPRRAAGWLLHRALNVARARRLRVTAGDVTIVNGFDNTFICRHRQPDPGVPSVLIVRDAPLKYRLPGQPPLEWALSQIRYFSHLVFPSENVCREWLVLEPVRSRPSVVIPNCCDEDSVGAVRAQDRDATRRRFGWPDNCIVVLCLASLQFLKGQDLLVGALPALVAAVPRIRLAFVGASSGKYGAEFTRGLQRELESADMAGYAAFLGPQRDSLEHLYGADILVVPSRTEVLPITILEAMALGTSVVASAVGGISELLEDGKSGCLFAAGDKRGLVESLVKLASDQDLRRSLAAAARERYWSLFSRDRLAGRFLSMLKSLMNGEEWEWSKGPAR